MYIKLFNPHKYPKIETSITPIKKNFCELLVPQSGIDPLHRQDRVLTIGPLVKFL